MDKQVDEALVERLAKTLYDSPAEYEGSFEICPALVFEEASEDAKQHYRSEGRKLLTALSETHAIVAKAEYEATEAALAKAIDVLGDKVVCPPQIVGNCYDYTDRDDCWMAYLKAPKEATPDA